jgi:hypothetical protein
MTLQIQTARDASSIFTILDRNKYVSRIWTILEPDGW